MAKYIFLISASFLIFSCAHKTQAPESPAKTAETTAKTEPVKTQPMKTSKDAKLKNYICKAGSDSRTVWTESLQPRGCQLWYSRFSTEKPIAHSPSGIDYCFKVEDNILANLKKSGFKCDMESEP
jgi:hypothetical protein